MMMMRLERMSVKVNMMRKVVRMISSSLPTSLGWSCTLASRTGPRC